MTSKFDTDQKEFFCRDYYLAPRVDIFPCIKYTIQPIKPPYVWTVWRFLNFELEACYSWISFICLKQHPCPWASTLFQEGEDEDIIGKINQTLIWNNMQWKSWLVNGTSEIVFQCDELYQGKFIKFLYNARCIKLFARCITNI